ncbi:unnamed protein product, partial [Nesidiocoris tenuis]
MEPPERWFAGTAYNIFFLLSTGICPSPSSSPTSPIRKERIPESAHIEKLLTNTVPRQSGNTK